jgi:MFS family permease
MVTPAAMTFFTRIGGNLAGRLGSRLLSWIGFSIIAVVLFSFSRLSSQTPQWLIVFLLFVFGVGAGLMLAVLHYAALNEVPDADLGTSSGIYSMIRFLGAASGTAFGGILLQFYLDQNSSSELAAYQHVFQWFVGFAILGIIMATFLPKAER